MPNTIKSCFTCFIPKYSISKSKNIKEAEIFDNLDIYCRGMPEFIRILLAEQIYVAIKRCEDSSARPLPDIHIYLPVKNLDYLPDFLLTLLTKYSKSKNNVVIHTLSGEFKITSEFISALKKGNVLPKIKFNCDLNDFINSEHFFIVSIIQYAEIIGDDKFKMMADILAMEIFLSTPDLQESNFFDFRLLQIDTQRMAKKNYFYHVFETDDIFDVFEDKKFREFATSSSQAEFNFIFGRLHSIAVSGQKNDNKLSFIVIDSYFVVPLITIKDLERYCRITDENTSGNSKTKKECPDVLRTTSNLKITTLNLETQADLSSCRIFARDSLFSLMKNKELSNALHQYGTYGESVFFKIGSKTSVTDIVYPSLVRFSQSSFVTYKYKESFEKRGLLNISVIKNKSNESQTWEQYRYEHSRNEEVLNKRSNKVETKFRNKGAVDKRIKLFTTNSDFFFDKLVIDKKELRSYFGKLSQVKG